MTLERPTPGSVLLAQGQLHTRVGLLLGGELTLEDPDLGDTAHLRVGDHFGWGATPQSQLTTWRALAGNNCHVAWLEANALKVLCQSHGALAYHFPSLPGTAHAAGTQPC